MALFDEKGERIRGTANKEAAEVALAREKLSWSSDANYPIGGGEWLVARVCSDYIQYCERGLAKGAISKGHRDSSVLYLNGLCSYCGALPVAQLKKAHVLEWMDQQTSWRSSETHRGVITIVLAAFNRAAEMHGIANPLKGLKKPKPKPRLHSFQPEDEEELYYATEPRFKDFLFAAIHTGLRPFCELAKVTADHVEETERGMMWRVYSSKTKKTRKIPIRPEVAKLVRTLMKTAPHGSNIPLFRNTKDKPWRQSAGVVRFLSLKEKLGWKDDPVRGKFSCYTCRHTFVHRMLAGYWKGGQGCTIETVAELIDDPVLFLSSPPGVDREVRRKSLDLVTRLNRQHEALVGDPEIEASISQQEMAFRMQMSVPELTDLSKENAALLESYGPEVHKTGSFARNCLLARRMAERNVRFIQVIHRGWDHHMNLPINLRAQARDIDQPIAAMLRDLKQRGLLDDTLVVFAGEFGRTTYGQLARDHSNFGRDHHPRCFTTWMAGGGIKGGICHGETDEFSYNVTADPVHVRDFHATILHQLGIDHARLSFPFQGLDQKLTGVDPARVVKEILA